MATFDARSEMKEELKLVEATAKLFLYALFAFVLIYSGSKGISNFIYTTAVFFVVIAAFGIAGGFLGFLFGIPKLLQGMGAIRAATGNAGQPAEKNVTGNSPGVLVTAGATKVFAGNTNLEEISDWLTKIIVGISLVQATTIFTEFKAVSLYFGTSVLQGAPGGAAVFFLVSIASMTLGFLFFYLETRTRITILLVTAETLNNAREVMAAANPSLDGLTPSAVEEPRRAPTTSQEDLPVVRVPYEQLDGADDLAKWGAANMRAGNTSAAERAFEAALKVKRDDPMLFLALAGAKVRLRKGKEAYRVVEEANRLFPNDRKVLRNKVLTALYLPPPTGYQTALETVTQLASLASKELERPRVQLWIAAANGQKFKHLTDGPDKEQAKKAAFESLKQLVALAPDPNAPDRVLAKQLFNPSAEGSHPEENDLEVFKDFPEFGELIKSGS